MSRRDWAAGGLFGTAIAFVVDLLAMGGDTLIAAVVLLLSDIDVIVTILSQLQILASGPIDSLDPETVQVLYYVAVALFLLTLVHRLAQSYYNRGSQ